MKKIALLSFVVLCSFSAGAQGVATLNQNFDISCSTAAAFPGSWQRINPISSTMPDGEWTCAPSQGRPNTTGGVPSPGMMCTGVYNTAFHLDTSYLITPMLNFNSIPAGQHIYLRFDTKTDYIAIGGKFGVVIKDTLMNLMADSTSAITPIIGTSDSTSWVSHQVNLSNYIGHGNFYVAFRYTSSTSYGTAWYLDNVKLTSSSLYVEKLNKDILPLTVIGNSTYTQIALSYTASTAGKYRIAIYDMVGRRVYDGNINADVGTASYIINDLDLHPGMYCIRMGNDNTYGTTKLMIQ